MHATARTAADIAADEEADDMKVDEILTENEEEDIPDVMEENVINDKPEITGIPNGDLLSDDEETYSEQEAKIKNPEFGSKEWVAEGGDAAIPVEEKEESLQNVPADNVETVAEDEAIIYVEQGDYPGGEVGQYIDVDNEIYEIVSTMDVEGEEYFAARKYVEPNFEEPKAYEEMLDINASAKLPKAPAVKEPEAEVTPVGSDFDIDLPVETIPVMTELESVEEEPQASVEEVKEEKGPIWKVIAAEIEELYGISDDSFKYELKDDQYNVVLDSGEAMTLPCSYIDSLIQEELN